MDIEVVPSRYQARFASDWHDCASVQLIYPSKGVMTLETVGGIWTVPPLQGCWLAPHERHRVETSNGFEMLSVYCQGSIVRKLPKQTGLVSISPLLREVILALVDEPDGPKRKYLGRILAEEIRISGPPPLFLPSLVSPRLRKIEQVLKENPADSRTLDQWAADLGTTTRTLARAFEREIRMSFTVYRRQVRLNAAIKCLAEGEYVTEAALRLGFSSVSAFIAMFRQATGVTPRRYFAPPSA